MAYLGETFSASNTPRSAIDELRSINSWVGWKYVERPGSPKPTKPPVNPHDGRGASHSNPLHWGSYKQAKMGEERYSLAGVGFVLSDKDDFTGIDLDNCRDPETEELEPWAEAAVALGETYWEVSPSGRGLRAFVRGKIPATIKCDPAGVEIYAKERYLTVTEDHVEGTPLDIRPAPKTLEMLIARVEAMRPASEPVAPAGKPAAPLPRPAASHGGAGGGFFRNVNDKALASLDMWVKSLFPTAKYQKTTNGYRVESKDLGRNLQEALSLTPEGIKDFGLADMGDPNQGKRSPIDTVIEHGGAPDAMAAAKWLCLQIGKTPESLGWREGVERDEEAARIGDKIAEGLIARSGAQEEQADAQAESTAQAGGKEQTDPLAGFRFDGDAENDAPPPMLVKKLVELLGICFIGGQSGAGKTFIVIYLAVCLASQEPFFGHKVTERVGVAIMAAEGAATIGHRITVARNHTTQGEPLPIAWLGAVPDLANEKEVKALIARLRALDAKFRQTHGVRLGAVVCDTLAASFNLADENDNSEAAKAIRAMSIMSRSLGVVIIPVHHFGKSTETGLRGASAWRAGCDTVLSVLADRDQTTGQCSDRKVALTKSRVGEEGWNTSFELRFVKLGEDDDGDEYGACYVEPGRAEDVIITVKEKGPPRYAKVFINALGIVIGDKGRKIRPFGSDGSEVTAVDREVIREEFYRLWAADGETDEARASARRKAFKRGEDWALDHGLAASYEVGKQHMVWPLRGDGQ